jgi:prophage regulatory protein
MKSLKLYEVEQRTGLSGSTIYAEAAKGNFPKPLKLFPDGKASGWIDEEIDEFIQRAIDRRPARVAAE